ncbi:M20/M25/M40 family metallo-hydrolase [Helcobacillus massiliensis]|uniref:M20/M25/M40 family metallo-hydrolase n=1 Tax=Helcobacillus massiliensis TaxID=521392 RepID=UPI0021A467CE|nr:M20/M25/M40 family metallo-hydrolase [Helcobacillus massiliensis]MCT1556806.1 M20/M25/M40 family metallo-hydrolase [Helcobacillus massiliensis]MCT2035630.1 M20/M25/M40 family metallo-hydrolase [Helcobacillus massiliensis]MCT2330918.1 M20/M25/M40 family metallo-hydrolase [Helcobacillus massiliensis]
MADLPDDVNISLPDTPRAAVEQLIALDTTSRDGNVPAIELLQRWLSDHGVITHVLREDDGINANLIGVIPSRHQAGGADGGQESVGALLPERALTPSDQLSRDLIGELSGVGKGGVDRLDSPTDGATSANPSADGATSSADAAEAPAAGERRGVLIAGHADCVPVDGQDWDSDPFTATERDGLLYGRGTCDMKSYLAVFAQMAGRFQAADLDEPVIFAATWEEETTCNGARELVKQLDALGIHPRVAFVGEPTMMTAIASHKSMNSFQATFHGIAAHSSLLPRGLNAIRYAGEFITWYHREVIDRLVEEGPSDDAFPVPHTTGGVNVVDAGIAGNTVPDHAHLTFEFRALPSVDVPAVVRDIQAKIDELDTAMKAAVPDDPADPSAAKKVGAQLTINSLLYPLDAAPDGPAAALAKTLGRDVQAEKVTYGTESGIYEHAGMSAVVIGPGDIAQAHGANEFVSLDQLEACEGFFAALLTHLETAQ